MLTCHIRYVIAPGKIREFKEYARAWMALITKHGGTHHGYFIPTDASDKLPAAAFSFPGLGAEGPADTAVALFSFPDAEAYESYRRAVAGDSECKAITARFNASKCFLSYERTFLKPVSGE